jgi:pimeloyl-ACP methyl ester carboxylesterase
MIRSKGEKPMRTLRLPHVLGALGAADSRRGELRKAIDADVHHLESADAGSIAYYADPRGSGPPLVLVHSVNAAASAYEVKPIFERFRGERPVYAIDLPGFGLSERADRSYTPRLYASAILHLLRQVAAKGGHVVALSLSSEFAALAALEAPELVRSLTLVAPTGFERPGSRPLIERVRLAVAKAAALPGLGRALFEGIVRRPVIDYFLRQVFVGQVDEGLASYAFESAHRPGAWHAPRAFLRGSLFSPEIREVYSRLREPVLVLHDRDPYGVSEQIDGFVRAHGGWRAQRVGPSRGLPHFERPEDTFGALEAFLRDSDVAGQGQAEDARAA